jgi:ABC-type transporter Mla subunit MlaD
MSETQDAVVQFANVIKTIINPELSTIRKGLKQDVDSIGTGLTKISSIHDDHLKRLNERMTNLELITEAVRSNQEKVIKSIQSILTTSETSSKRLGDFYTKQSEAMNKIIQGFAELETHTPIKILMEQLKDAKHVRNEVLRTLSKVVKK